MRQGNTKRCTQHCAALQYARVLLPSEPSNVFGQCKLRSSGLEVNRVPRTSLKLHNVFPNNRRGSLIDYDVQERRAEGTRKLSDVLCNSVCCSGDGYAGGDSRSRAATHDSRRAHRRTPRVRVHASRDLHSSETGVSSIGPAVSPSDGRRREHWRRESRNYTRSRVYGQLRGVCAVDVRE